MAELSRKGHRQRVKDAYMQNKLDGMADHNVLELVLFYSIPQKDVKPLAYDLINHFGSLENVFNADVHDLMKVDGIKEHSAILISLFRNVNIRINQSYANNLVRYNTFEKLAEYASLMLRDFKNERIMVVTLDNELRIINTHFAPEGRVNESSILPRELAEIVLRDNAPTVVLAHNHPNGKPTPSRADIDMTRGIIKFLKQLRVTLTDHIIVGENGETQSLKGDLKYAYLFD